ncbi:MAG: hypothetical protein ACE5IJ_07395, partial [Thermoplasmata archaeon]
KLNAEAELLPEGADVALKTDKGLKEELDHGKPIIREVQLDNIGLMVVGRISSISIVSPMVASVMVMRNHRW